MVAELPILLSFPSPETTVRCVLGDRFHYFRGVSGRRYLFTRIARADLADFRSAVVMLAHREPRGYRAFAVAELDRDGRLRAGRRWPRELPRDCIVLVHLLAERATDRGAVVADLTSAALADAA
jgi:hypothetical protein